jgi:hypothetical protein
MIPACITVGFIVLGAYALTWRVMAWAREDVRLLEEGERVQCPSIKDCGYRIGVVTLRCELNENHHGPHTAQLHGHIREHWN